MTSTVTMHIGDVRDVMARLPDNYADLLVTSPPFLALRSYLPADHPDKHREIGSEPTPAAFLDTLYGLTADWRRLIPEWGSICVELGDTMSGSGGAGGDYLPGGIREGQDKFEGSGRRTRPHRLALGYSGGSHGHDTKEPGVYYDTGGPGWPLAKSMCLMPHAYTIGLAYGHNPLTGQPHDAGQWRIRNVITWARPNPPVGSLGKRNPDKRTGDYKFRPACSFITVACRGTGRYFDLDAVRTEHNPNNHRPPVAPGQSERQHKAAANPLRNDVEHTYNNGNPAGAPPLDWHTDDLDGDWLWKLATAPYPGSHYATYPLALPRRLVLAMCPQSVCTVCGWPRERVTESVRTLDGEPVDPTVVDWSAQRNGSTAIGVDHNRVGRRSTTLGFTDCGHDNYRPGTVIDPFGGSGTTAVAAALEGRNATLIDLDRRNVDLVRRRLAENVRIISEVHDGDTVVWTVEQVTRTELVADAGGQMDLFAS
jgi:hypothetical protein